MAQSDTILIKDLPGDILSAVGAEVPRRKASTPVEASAGEGSAAPVAENESDEENVLLGSQDGNPFDAAYQKLRSEKENNILEHGEREFIQRALQESGGKQVKAAEILGMTRATLRKRIDRYDLGS